MEAILKQIQHQIKQKKEQIVAEEQQTAKHKQELARLENSFQLLSGSMDAVTSNHEISSTIARVAVNTNRYKDEKWAKHYSSNHRILLVGEGDFSFALSLALSFGSASNIIATSLDTYDEVIKKYERAKWILKLLVIMGGRLFHGVDATIMKVHPHLLVRKFDRIIYNFPHAGFFGKEDDPQVIGRHQTLVRGFFQNASLMLRPNGEVHVTHKTTPPFDRWYIDKLAAESHLALLECVKFKHEDYPCYENKRGDGPRSDYPFPLRKCSTFKFVSSSKATSQPQEIPLHRQNAMNRRSSLVDYPCLEGDSAPVMNMTESFTSLSLSERRFGTGYDYEGTVFDF